MGIHGQPSERTALILYGSETGNAQDVAEEIGRITERLRFATIVTDLNAVGIVNYLESELLHYTVVIFAISTTGQGDVPTNARSFWKKIRSVRLQPGCLGELKFTSFGLGDSSYPQFNWAHRKLYNRIKQLGGVQLCDRGESDEQHPQGIDASFLPWTTKLRETLLTLYPLPTRIGAIPDDVFLTPRWSLVVEEPFPKTEITVAGDSTFLANERDLKSPTHRDVTTSPMISASLLENIRLTPETHWQDVRLFEFSTPDMEYYPGDVLTIFPHNSATNVDEFLSIMGWTSLANKYVKFVASDDRMKLSDPLPVHFSADKDSGTTLRDFILRQLDLNAIPRRSFFAAIAHFTADEMQKTRLIEFTNPEYIDELFDYTTRPRRSILEVLQEFDTVKIPLKWIASVVPTIRGRQFSIASGGNLKTFPDGLGRIQLLVAIVKYRTVIKKIREGLCTKYMAGLRPGTQLDVQLCKSGMKVIKDRPSIMIGPGTGIAPLRSMLHERIASDHCADPKADRQLLFYGGRNRAADYFFEEDWDQLGRKMPLEVFTAFSRDQAQKYYVQDAIRKEAEAVYAVLQDGVVYVCGSSGKMPLAVREALVDVFAQEGGLERLNAEAQLALMEKSGRYQQETW